MISKETFVKTINSLQELDSKMSAVDNAMKILNGDFCGFYITEPFDIAINLLEESLDDKEGWISYFIFERDWLEDLTFGDIEINGIPVSINNWEEAYDFIVERGKEV